LRELRKSYVSRSQTKSPTTSRSADRGWYCSGDRSDRRSRSRVKYLIWTPAHAGSHVASTAIMSRSSPSALGHLGEVDEARRVWREAHEINRSYSFAGHFGRLGFREGDVRRIAEGLEKAGLSP
jgi:hypothetical protein